MTDEDISNLIIQELRERTLGVTEQYLAIHEPIYENGMLVVERIDRETYTPLIVVYLPVKGEHFSFAIFVDTAEQQVFNFATESRNTVTLRATSAKLSAVELQALTKITPTRLWNRGDYQIDNKSKYNFSCIEFEPNAETDIFENKLTKLLYLLEADKKGIRNLSAQADIAIEVTIDYHAGNQLLGSFGISRQHLSKLHGLGLEINFNITAWGKPFI